MLSIAHATTGAFLGSLFPNPLVYVPSSMGMHYFEDWIPHWDVGTGLGNGTRSPRTAFLLELIDLALAVGIVYFFWQYGHAEIQWHVWLGAFFGLLPDFMEAPRNFLKWEPLVTKPLNWFHSLFHHSTPNVLFGLTPQLILIATIFFLR
jgi:hypothetical protein